MKHFHTKIIVIVLIIFAAYTSNFSFKSINGKETSNDLLSSPQHNDRIESNEDRVSKDPFREFLEKKDSAKITMTQQPESIVKKDPKSKDPFKEFLDAQESTKGSAGKSPFESSR
jgi:hypothetical protein